MAVILTLQQLLSAFETYNLAIWPLQIVAYVLGAAVITFIFYRTNFSSTLIAAILSFLWLWTGIVFFMFYFAPIYTPAYAFGGLFIIQGFLFLLDIRRKKLSFAYPGTWYSMLGLVFLLYALVGYPVFGYLIGHRYPQSPPFGLTPCPLAVFTFGLYLQTDREVPVAYLIIPLLWGLGGFLPASIGVLEDIGLIAAGILGTAALVYRDHIVSRRTPAASAP